MSKSKRFISLAEHNPELISEWHTTKNKELTPKDISYGSAIKLWWKCSAGHEWEATPNDRTRGRGCPECAKNQRAITKRKNIVLKRGSLAENNPNLVLEWHPTKNGTLTPRDISVNSPQRVWWRCLKDKRHEWEAPINSRNSGVGCPVCSGHKIVAGINDLATVRPDLAAQWHPTKNGNLKSTDVTIGNGNNVWWICEKGHEWNAKIANRAYGNNCPKCFGEAKTSFPEQVIYFYFNQVTCTYNRYMVAPKTEIDVYLPEYKIGIEYDGAYFHEGEEAKQREIRKEETLNKLGILLIRVRELEETTAGINIYIKPGATDIELGKMVKVLLERISKIIHIEFNIDIDIERDRHKIFEQYIQKEKENSLLLLNPKLASEWHPTKNGNLKASDVTCGSDKKVWWQCKNGHEWQATISSRNGGNGCKACYLSRRKSKGE